MRFIVYLVLVTLVINTGDWPYLDEFLEDVAYHQLETKDAAADLAGVNRPQPAKSMDHCNQACHLLLQMQCIVSASLAIPAAHVRFAAPPMVFFLPWHLPDNPYRPPIAPLHA